jgi:hypothetical protein
MAWPTVESHNPGARPLPVGAVKRVNRYSTRLPHKLNRSDSIPKLNGSASIDGSEGGGGMARDGVGEVGDMVVRGASGPWDQLHGPMEILAVQRITGASVRLVTTEI